MVVEERVRPRGRIGSTSAACWWKYVEWRRDDVVGSLLAAETRAGICNPGHG